MTTTDPRRKHYSVPVDRWPKPDRHAWEEACKPGSHFERGGRAAHMRSVSREALERRYGAFLGFLDRLGKLDRQLGPGELETPENVDAHLNDLQARVSSVTCHTWICKLRRMTDILDPACDIEWLREIERDLDFLKVPKAKHDRIVLTDRIAMAGLTLFEQAEVSAAPNRRTASWRETV